ncbi:MAG TPA: CPBP family intramembrane glutamic endopeptidase [Xanthobacteraceae bacterium]|nr:CPBP family intramembrane glutamic endopeptidase [Xanthobacteraceae bacterium]
MNILIVLAVAAGGVVVLWAVQSIVLLAIGEPLAWPLRFAKNRPLLKWTGRVIVHTEWLIILIGTPFALGMTPLAALHQAFPTPVPWKNIAIAGGLMLFATYATYAFYWLVGWIRYEPQGEQAIRRAKLFRRFLPGPLPLVVFEEGVFRGILLEQLLRSLPASDASTILAIVLSSAVFASVHFVKPAKGKPVFQAAYGYFLVGCLFGLAYVIGGRSLWLPVAVHTAAVFGIEVLRLYVKFEAPRWLIGFSESPQSGLVGSAVVGGVALALPVLI